MAEPQRTPTVAEAVAQKLAASGPEVQERVIAELAKKELDRRTSMLLQAIGKLDELEAQLKKLDRPDQKILTRAGAPIQEGYSPAKIQELEKVQKQIKKWQDAINDALGRNDYKKLDEVMKGGGKPDPADEPEAGSGPAGGR